MDTIERFLGLVVGVLTFHLGTIRGLQAASDGLGVAVAIMLLGCVSNALGDSPLLFIRRMAPRQVAITLAIATLFAMVRLAVWAGTFGLAASVVERHLIALPRVLLVVGIGYAPMLLSVLIVLPTLGPFLARVLHLWVLLTVTAG